MTDLVTEAATVAGQRLNVPGLARRWAHVQAVGARAAELAVTVEPGERCLLVAAGWLHDIGYAPDAAVTGFHPLDGARFLSALGWPDRLVALVAHHSGARIEAELRGLNDDLVAYRLEDSAVADALVTADMTTGPDGQRLTFAERMDEILARYQPDHVVHQAMIRARPVLQVQVDRVWGRLDRLQRGQPI